MKSEQRKRKEREQRGSVGKFWTQEGKKERKKGKKGGGGRIKLIV